MPLTQVLERFRSLLTPSTLSGGLMNSCVVSEMVSRAIGLAKMLDCEMWPRLCDHCAQTHAPPNNKGHTGKTEQLGVSRRGQARCEARDTQARDFLLARRALLTLRTLPVVSIPGLPSGRVGNFLLLPGGRDAIIFGSGPDDSSGFTKPLEVVLFHSGFLPPALLAGRARRVPSLSPGRNVTRVGRRAFVKPVSFDGKMSFVAGPDVLFIHVVIVAFGSAGAM
jgi:hypothetical protein